MKKISTLAILFMAFTLSIFAQNKDQSLLWKISGNGLKSPSYVFGTIHLTCDASLNDRIKKALDETSLLVLELDMDDPKMQMDLMQSIAMKDGKTVKEMVSEEDYTLLNDFFKEQLGIPFDMFNTYKPFMSYAMLYTKMLDCTPQSVEASLMQVAHQQNEEILGLETVQEQAQIFDEIPYKDQLKDLLKTVKNNLVDDKELFTKMQDIYKNEDIDKLFSLIEDADDQIMSQHNDKLLDGRNKNWIPKIKEFSSKQAVFYGVGAGHLGGENGVLNLLKKEGYTVTPVTK